MVWKMPNLLKVSGTQVHEKYKSCHLTSYSDWSDIDSCHLCSVTRNYTMAHDVLPKNHHFTFILSGFITYLWLRNAWEWKGRCQSLSGLWEICEFFGNKSREQSLNTIWPFRWSVSFVSPCGSLICSGELGWVARTTVSIYTFDHVCKFFCVCVKTLQQGVIRKVHSKLN